jgi:hypothetical protein
MDVEIRNFQSIKHIRLRLDGYTALVGRSNIGKSAVVRAITAALSGASGTNFVRHAPTCPRRVKSAKSCKCFASVHLRREGFDLLWEKGDAINRYTYNGQIYDRADRGTPDFLTPAFSPVTVGTGSVLLQAAPQTKPIFLLDQTGGVVADVLADVANLDRINVAIRLAEKDKREAAATRKVRASDVLKLEAREAGFVGLDGALAQVERLGQVGETLARKRGQIERLDRWADGLTRTERDLGRLLPVERVPDMDSRPLRAAWARFDRIGHLDQRLNASLRAVKRLLPAEMNQVPDRAPLRDAWGRYQRISGWVTRMLGHRASFQRLDRMASLPALDATPIQGAWGRYRRLRDLGSKLGGLVAEVRALEADMVRLEAEGVKVQAEADALGVCSKCARPLHGPHGTHAPNRPHPPD